MFLLKIKDKNKLPSNTSSSPVSKLKPPSSLRGLSSVTNSLTTTSTASNSSCSPTFSNKEKAISNYDSKHIQLKSTKSTNLDEYLNLRQGLKLASSKNNDKLSNLDCDVSKESDLEFLEQAPTSAQSSKIKRQFTINIPNNRHSLLDNLVNIDASSIQDTTKQTSNISNVNSKINKLIGKNSSIPSFSSVRSSNGFSSNTVQANKLVKNSSNQTLVSPTVISNPANSSNLSNLINHFNKDSNGASLSQTGKFKVLLKADLIFQLFLI